MEKRDLLESALPVLYLKKLRDLSWNLQVISYNKTILRLKELEPEIVEVIKDQNTLMELKRESKSTGTISKGGRRDRLSIKASANDGDTNYRNCTICNKCHSGVCRLAGKIGHR